MMFFTDSREKNMRITFYFLISINPAHINKVRLPTKYKESKLKKSYSIPTLDFIDFIDFIDLPPRL